MAKDIDRVVLTYLNSSRPDCITLAVQPRGRIAGSRVDMSPADAVALASRLLTAVNASGYALTARRRPR